MYQAISFRALGSDVAAGQLNSSSENRNNDGDVVLPLRCEVGGLSKNRKEVGVSKKSKRKHVLSRFALASLGKISQRKGFVGKGRLDEVPATPEKRNMAPVCETPEKLERRDEEIVRWVQEKVGAECFGKTKGASTWDCRRHRGFVGNAPKAIGLRDVVVLTLTQENGALIVSNEKQWEGRPVVDKKIKSVALQAKVCFQVGSYANPWYTLCNVVEKEYFESVEQMIEHKVQQLLPMADYSDLTGAVSYYRSLGKQYREGGGYIAFKVVVLCFWKGRRCE